MLLGICFISQIGFSQEIITLVNGDVIRAKILEIRQTEISYKKFDLQSGPTYIVNKSDIATIAYEDGTKDSFNSDQSEQEVIEPTAEVPTPAKVIETDQNQKKFSFGFSAALQEGTWPATALTNMGSSSFLVEQGHTVKGFGFGILMHYRLSKKFSLFLDGNIYNYNIQIGSQGTDAHSTWTVAESAMHWDEPGAPQIQYVHNLPTDVFFDMTATGFRLGGKYYFLNGKARPWVGAGFGFYEWEVNYCNKKKDKTYGKDRGFVPGFTYLVGIDIKVMPGFTIAPFLDMASPVAKYKIEGLFYPQWDIEYDSPIMAAYRLGLSIIF